MFVNGLGRLHHDISVDHLELEFRPFSFGKLSPAQESIVCPDNNQAQEMNGPHDRLQLPPRWVNAGFLYLRHHKFFS